MGWQEDRKNINHAKALAACRASGLIKVKDVYDPPTPWLWWGWHRGHVRIKIDFPGYFQLEFGSAEDPSALENILCSPGPQVETACWLQACSSHFSHREDVWEAVSLPFVTQGKGVYGSFTVKHFQYIPARSALWEEEEDVGELSTQCMDHALCCRPQYVHLKTCIWRKLLFSTRSPPGTVLSPFLSMMYTPDFPYNTRFLEKLSDESLAVSDQAVRRNIGAWSQTLWTGVTH